MSSNAGEWCLMESDPGVFTELIKGFGCRGAQVEEIRFNLMAIVSDRKMIYEQKIAELQRQLAEEEPMDTDQGSTVLSAIQSEVARNQMLIEEEVQKLKRYKIENIRRKHNYLPFIMELLKTLAEHQQLIPLVEKAKEKQNAKKAQETK